MRIERESRINTNGEVKRDMLLSLPDNSGEFDTDMGEVSMTVCPVAKNGKEQKVIFTGKIFEKNCSDGSTSLRRVVKFQYPFNKEIRHDINSVETLIFCQKVVGLINSYVCSFYTISPKFFLISYLFVIISCSYEDSISRTMQIQGIDFTNVILWLALGLVAGIIVSIVDRGRVKGGAIGTMLTGIVGALLGGLLASTYLGIQITGFNIQSVLIAVAGGLILGFIERLLFRDRSHIKTESGRMGRGGRDVS